MQSSIFERPSPVALALCLSSCAAIAPDDDAEASHDWRAMPHHVSVLFAGTAEDEEAAPSIGLDYEYRVDRFLGIGGVAEYAFEEIDATTLLGVADLHWTDQFIVQTGPGVEFIHDRSKFVYRIGVLYEWERGGYTVSPQLHYDATGGDDAVVFGIAVGVGF